MSEISLEAESRELMGKGASRRLRRLEGKVPAVLYGGEKPTQSIQFLERHVVKAFESEKIYSSVFDIKVDGKSERVILKDVQRHPAKALILHMDFQRVSAKDILVKVVPLHYINEEEAPGVKAGGVVNHTMTQLEVRCEARNLPEFIEIDLAAFEMDQVLHLSELTLPKGVEIAMDIEGDHDHPVVSVHEPKVIIEEEPEVESDEEGEEGEEGAEAAEGAEGETAEGESAEGKDAKASDEAKKEGGEDKPAE